MCPCLIHDTRNLCNFVLDNLKRSTPCAQPFKKPSSHSLSNKIFRPSGSFNSVFCTRQSRALFSTTLHQKVDLDLKANEEITKFYAGKRFITVWPTTQVYSPSLENIKVDTHAKNQGQTAQAGEHKQTDRHY